MAERDELTAKEGAIVVFQGLLKGVPYLGSSLEHFIFGRLAELRMKRIEKTLAEIAECLGAKKAATAVNEQFTTLLESMTPELGRALAEDKRHRFRDLLTNAAELSEESTEWEEARLASSLLKEVEAPGLAILAALAMSDRSEPCVLTARPVPQVFRGDFNYDSPGQPQQVLPYQWVVIEYWARWLRDKRLITYNSHDARGGFGGVSLAQLGRFLIKWTLRSEAI